MNRVVMVFLFAGLFLSGTQVQAQKHPVLIDAKEVIKEGVTLYEDEKYDEAIEKFVQVHPSDSDYFTAQYELSLCYLAKKEYEKVIEISKNAIAEGSLNSAQYNIWGTALDELKRKEESIKIYNTGIAKFPYNQLLYLNKGIVYEGMEERGKALEVYKKLLTFAPFHASTHLRLARMNVQDGNLTQAIMSYTIFLMIEPASKRSLNVLSEFNKLCDGSSGEVGSSKNKAIKKEFEDIDFLVSNQVALNDKYKVPGKYKFPVVKQIHLILEKLAEIKNPEPGYYADFYLPFFKAINKNKTYETFALLMLASSDNENISKQVAKKVSDIKSLREECIDIWNKEHYAFEIVLNGKTQKLKKWYFGDFAIQAFGVENSSKKNTGDWMYITYQGTPEVLGTYDNNGERNGEWYFFHTAGDTLKMITYKNGKAHGPYKIYKDGFLKEIGTYENDILEGDILAYYPDGTLSNREQFSNDKRNGAVTAYYSIGTKRYEYTYEKGLLNGALKDYYKNTKLSETSTYEAGKATGNYKAFYEDGQLKKDFNYVNGIIEGPYKTYWRNGILESEGNAMKGNVSGKWKYYYSDGKIRELSAFDESGKVNGESESFDHQGRKYKQSTFQRDDLKRVQFFDTKGKVFYESKINRSGTLTKYYDFHRDKISEGRLTDGERDGEWKFYFVSGEVSGTELYVKKIRSGKAYEYFKNGKVSVEENYSDNNRDGYYKSMFSNAKMHMEGNYVKGDRWGPWYEYYIDGTLKKESYYIAGELRGMVYEYGVSGKLYRKYQYNNYGDLTGVFHCDTSGMVNDSSLFKSGSALLSLKGVSGKKYFDGKYVSGTSHGKQQWFLPNGKVETGGSYYGGFRDGDWLWRHPNDKPALKGSYLNGEKTGDWIYYDYFGTVIKKGEYKYGELHGKFIWYYGDGKICSQSEYYEDNRNNTSYYYARTGELREARYYVFGKYIGYSYQDKNKKMVDTIYAVNGGGEVKSFYANGNVSSHYTMKCGEYHGVYKLFYPDGKLQEERLYDYGMEIGPTKEYDNTGKLLRIENYNQGSLEGEVIEYYENGGIKLKENYVNDSKHGLCEYFDKAGKRIGAAIYYNDEVLKIIL
ncbi:MAG: hypothetical protein Q8M15_03815 [Bacteroidota bacterium]|nr:hypothetical protein [Bacteroidota bacterium]